MVKQFNKYPIPEAIAEDYDEIRRLIENEDYEAAENLLKNILDREPGHPRVMTELATVYYYLREYDNPKWLSEAEEILLDVIEAAPDLAEAHALMGIVLRKTGQRREADEHTEAAVELYPETAQGWNFIGFYYGGLAGNYTKALDCFLTGYTLEPGNETAAFNISCTYARLGKAEAALEYLEDAVKSKRLLARVPRDNNLNSLRDLPRFTEIVAAAKKRFGIE
ncbi:MAG: tetratricopeptide repeat protein [bacterium]|nr:tetratricopeptide repeat protein [bacterium]